jgi:hypothetical protein
LKEAHKEAEELQDEQLHGVPDVEHKMKKVIPPDHTLHHLLIHQPRSATAAFSPSDFEPVPGRGRRMSNMRRSAGVKYVFQVSITLFVLHILRVTSVYKPTMPAYFLR